MTHLGVGPLTALVFELIIGKAERFPCVMQSASYVGVVPLRSPAGIGQLGQPVPRFILGLLDRWGDRLVPFVFIFLGTYILYPS